MVSWFQPSRRRADRAEHPASDEDNQLSCIHPMRPVRPTFSAAAAFATAKLTPRMALAPRLVLFFDPSSLRRNSSTLACSFTSISCLISSGPMVSLTFLTAFRTPFPPHFDLSPSRSSQASAAPRFAGQKRGADLRNWIYQTG